MFHTLTLGHIPCPYTDIHTLTVPYTETLFHLHRSGLTVSYTDSETHSPTRTPTKVLKDSYMVEVWVPNPPPPKTSLLTLVTLPL